MSVVSLFLPDMAAPTSWVNAIPVRVSATSVVFFLGGFGSRPMSGSVGTSTPCSYTGFTLLVSDSVSSVFSSRPVFTLVLILEPSPVPRNFRYPLVFFKVAAFPESVGFTGLFASVFSYFTAVSVSNMVLPFYTSLF